MAHQSNLIETDILAYLKSQEHKSLLRFITCGSVDDGKSTLIGRLLYESKLIYEDQLDTLQSDSKKVGTQGDNIDFALLVDGLASEREQGITIDVAYRYFSTDKRKFIVADTPGHEQYTRNMATGASTAELAILMIDARHGIMTQTRRHSTLVQLLGVDKIVLAINKMDLVDYSEARYQAIVDDYQAFATSIGISNSVAIPVSALKGDNIVDTSTTMPWYTGPSLLTHLETVPLRTVDPNRSFSMPVQWVNRPNLDFRGFAGQITTGQVAVGDPVTVLPANVSTTVESIVTMDGNCDSAIRGQSITVTLADEVDVSRGDVLVGASSPVRIGNQFISTIVWMADTPMVPNQLYWIKTRAKLLTGSLEAPQHRLDINTLDHLDAPTLTLNEIGACVCTFDQPIPYEYYQDNPHLGSFIIVDRQSNNTVGMGLIQSTVATEDWAQRYVQQRAKYWRPGQVSVSDRSQANEHRSLLVVITGQVPRQVYSDLGVELEKCLFDRGVQTYRHGFQFLRQADADTESITELRQDMLRHLMDIGYAFLDAGLVFITAIRGLTPSELNQLTTLAAPFDIHVIDLDTPVQSVSDRATTIMNQIQKG